MWWYKFYGVEQYFFGNKSKFWPLIFAVEVFCFCPREPDTMLLYEVAAIDLFQCYS